MEKKIVDPEYEALLIDGFQKWVDTHLLEDEPQLCNIKLRTLLEHAWLSGLQEGMLIVKQVRENSNG
jgi:hypothetical protein